MLGGPVLGCIRFFMLAMIDIGVNLTDRSFDRDRDAVLARAHAAGVSAMIVTGTDPAHSRAAWALTQAHPQTLFATAGVHPHHASEWGPQAEHTVAELAAAGDAVVAIGECGLDFDRDYSPRDAQERAFEAQLELAAETGLPVFLHQRAAHRNFVAILERHRHRLSGAVVHCFTGDREELAAYLELDLHIGVTGWICDERRGHALRDSVVAIPPERLMLETDAPYLLPRDLRPRPRSRRNEPQYLPHIADAVATLVQQSPQTLAQSTSRNARRFFRLP